MPYGSITLNGPFIYFKNSIDNQLTLFSNITIKALQKLTGCLFDLDTSHIIDISTYCSSVLNPASYSLIIQFFDHMVTVPI